MSNPDMPGRAASTRLAEEWPCEPSWRWWWPLDGGLPAQWFHSEGETDPAVPARSIGEMLEEIRRRGWDVYVRIDQRTIPPTYVEITAESMKPYAMRCTMLADALALALAEAMEAEKEKP